MHRLTRHRAVRAVVVLLVLVPLLLLSVGVRSAAGDAPVVQGGCNIFTPSCTVGVRTGGHLDTSGGTPAPVSTGCQNTDPFDGGCNPCPPTAAFGARPPAVTPACASYLQNQYCAAVLGDALGGLAAASVAALSAEQTSELNASMVSNGCASITTPASVAEKAVATIRFPHPSGHRSPSEDLLFHGYAFSYVNLWTFFWTDPATWHPVTASASAAGVTATVTATPVELVFDPGDGSDPVSCDGPGRPWVDADGFSPPSDGACAYQYRHVSPTHQPFTSTQSIVWALTWTGTGHTGGTIPSITTSTSGQLQVMQIETVVVDPTQHN